MQTREKVNGTLITPKMDQAPAPVPATTTPVVKPAPAAPTYNVYDITPGAPGVSAAVYYTKSTDDPAYGTNADQYDRIPPELKAVADQYAKTHGIDPLTLSSKTNTVQQTQEPQPIFDTSKITRDMQVTIIPEGGPNQLDITRKKIASLPNWTPVNLGGDSDNTNVFAYDGGLVDKYGYAYSGYTGYSVPTNRPNEEDIKKVNQYLNNQINGKPNGAVIDPQKDITVVNPLSYFGGQQPDPAYYNKIPISLRPSPLAHTVEQPAPAPYLGIIPAWAVGDVIAFPGNVVSGVEGLVGETGSIIATGANEGPVAAVGKAGGDFMQFERDLGKSIIDDPARYLYNIGLGFVAGAGISKLVGAGGGIVTNTIKRGSTPVKAYGENIFRASPKTVSQSANIAIEETLPITDGMSMLDESVLPTRGVSISNAPSTSVSRLTPPSFGKGIINNILVGYSREAPESYAPKYYYTPTTGIVEVPRVSFMDKVFAAYGREAPESYVSPKKSVLTIDLTKESENLRMQDLKATQKSAYQSSKADMSRTAEINSVSEINGVSGSIKYTGKTFFADEKGSYGGVRQILVNPETVKLGSGAKNLLTSSIGMGGILAMANINGITKQRVNIKQSPKPFTFSEISYKTGESSALFDMVRVPVTTKSKQTPSTLMGSDGGTPPINNTVQSSGVNLASMIGSGVGLGALMYGSSKLLSMGSLGGMGGGVGARKFGVGLKRETYKTGDINSLIYGKKKRRAKR